MLLSNILPVHSAHSLIAREAQPRSVARPVYHLEDLLANHQQHHSAEPLIACHTRQFHIGKMLVSETLTYDFFGRPVSPSSDQFRDMQRFNAFPMPLQLSETAALMLHQEFGAENIVWNKQSDCIEVKAPEFMLTIGGTNLVEAAIYLPRIYHSLLGRLATRQIPEGVSSVRAQVGGEAQEFAQAASPLKISLQLPNPLSISVSQIDVAVEGALARVLAKRSGSAIPVEAWVNLPAIIPHCG